MVEIGLSYNIASPEGFGHKAVRLSLGAMFGGIVIAVGA